MLVPEMYMGVNFSTVLEDYTSFTFSFVQSACLVSLLLLTIDEK